MIRSAELTLSNNYKYFTINNEESKNIVYGSADTIDTKPSTHFTIHMFKEPPNEDSVIDAVFICSNLAPKYDIKCNF